MNELILSQQGKNMLQVADFELVEQALHELDGENHSRISVSDDEGGYVKVIGQKDMLCVSYGRRLGARISHYVLGLSKRAEDEVVLNFDDDSILIKKNELMEFDDALLICFSFFEGRDFPAAYNMREIENRCFNWSKLYYTKAQRTLYFSVLFVLLRKINLSILPARLYPPQFYSLYLPVPKPCGKSAW